MPPPLDPPPRLDETTAWSALVAAAHVAPRAILTAVLAVAAHAAGGVVPPAPVGWPTGGASWFGRGPAGPRAPAVGAAWTPPPDPFRPLGRVVADVAAQLDAANVTHWLLPGAALRPPGAVSSATAGRSDGGGDSSDSGADPPLVGHLGRHQEVLDLAIPATHLPRLLSRAPDFAASGYELLETHYGWTVCTPAAAGGTVDARHACGSPSVGLFPLSVDAAGRWVNGCCDCAPTVLSSCTKTLCACAVCVWDEAAVRPLRRVAVGGWGGVVGPGGGRGARGGGRRLGGLGRVQRLRGAGGGGGRGGGGAAAVAAIAARGLNGNGRCWTHRWVDDPLAK
ncbi:hypothetical protein BU14_0052s0052 [Porphyra umbilicalis]|uniref:Uncharacterized protein n=1 Tax=Porphyra umbilicalis TaxID=2786 RepID=A0A1X6PI70_PORUM|nr:hypothetical protein BU14_0052s0052 [Porphyra umbilicalis]|eukprot:OSX80436.1 hypothetical protein BU14_0052s0052 [Porphyra umbilicalis]